MTRFGDWPLSEEMCPVDAWRVVVPNQAIAINSTVNFTVGTYTMPITGALVVEMKARMVWTQDQQWIRAYLGPSSPAPTSFTNHSWWSGLAGGFTLQAEVPVSAYWSSLSKGTVVTLTTACACGNLAGGVTVIAIGGFVRAVG